MDVLKYSFCLFLTLLLLPSCSQKRSVVTDYHEFRNDSSSITNNDSIKSDFENESKKKEEASLTEDKYVKETEYDEKGNVIKVTETYILSNFRLEKVEHNFNKGGLIGIFNSTEDKGSSSNTSEEKKETIVKDSRAVQGTEWIWFLSFTLILGIFMFFYFKK